MFHALSKTFSDSLIENGMRGEKMYFEYLLDALLGQRELLHAMECQICGYDEIYYNHPSTGKQIGRACGGCQFVQVFDFKNSHGQ
jgi:hypothetical protein